MADETTGISIKEQLAICIRYFDTTSYEIQEKCFKFIGVVDVSGENIASTILQDRLNLDISYYRGQAYDGGSNMSGKFKGVQKMCETRWVEKHDAVLTFIDTLPCLYVVLETISEFSESRGLRSTRKAFSFLHAIQSSEFLVSMVVLAEVVGLTPPLARKLQAWYMDVLETIKLVEATLGSLREKRYKSTDIFKKIFKESEKLSMEMGPQINKPSTTNLQKNRSKLNSQTVEEYYHTAEYVPFMDFIINEVSSRFTKSEIERVGQIQKLLSPEFSDGFEDEVLQGAEPYKDDLPCFSTLKGELRDWKQIWKSYPSQKFPKSHAEGYKQASAIPNIRRSFSTLRRLKTYLRSTMTEDRLNGLALLHIHQDITSAMKPEEVLDIFARKHKRELSLNFL
ncbi:hypothetical protein PR048_019652 [Dryococelus australis]|uniref:Uncharacterized protein n=1 Tax=Dryococelus australis TaxID=614101 RepID=A0ABQ9H423_9NEOP|nr:hypothetical protein PR048_019652 [Dryococelus australis]